MLYVAFDMKIKQDDNSSFDDGYDIMAQQILPKRDISVVNHGRN